MASTGSDLDVVGLEEEDDSVNVETDVIPLPQTVDLTVDEENSENECEIVHEEINPRGNDHDNWETVGEDSDDENVGSCNEDDLYAPWRVKGTSEEECVDVEAVEEDEGEATIIAGSTADGTTIGVGLSPLHLRIADFKTESTEDAEEVLENVVPSALQGLQPAGSGNELNVDVDAARKDIQAQLPEAPMNNQRSEEVESQATSTWNSLCAWDTPEAVEEFARKFHEAIKFFAEYDEQQKKKKQEEAAATKKAGRFFVPRRSPRAAAPRKRASQS